MIEQEKSVQELMGLEREILRMFQAGDVDQAMDTHLMEQAIVCPPGMERIVGRENQKAMFKELLKMEGIELSWEPIEAFVGPSNDMGYVYGSVNWKMPNEARQQGKYISIWVKTEGKWKNIVEIRNSNK
jgi:ketosteroid isomerase-like protein